MTFGIKLGLKTTLGNVTRYQFSVTRNTGSDRVAVSTTYPKLVDKNEPKSETIRKK